MKLTLFDLDINKLKNRLEDYILKYTSIGDLLLIDVLDKNSLKITLGCGAVVIFNIFGRDLDVKLPQSDISVLANERRFSRLQTYFSRIEDCFETLQIIEDSIISVMDEMEMESEE